MKIYTSAQQEEIEDRPQHTERCVGVIIVYIILQQQLDNIYHK